MALAYDKANALAKDLPFIDRVESCLIANARTIQLSTGETSPRKDVAYQALIDSRNWAVRFAYGAAMDGSVTTTAQASITDATINGILAAIFNIYIAP